MFRFRYISNCKWFLPRGSITTKIQHTIIQLTYTIHISHKITPLKTNKQDEEKQISSQSYTNSGHITANEYSVEEGEEEKLSLIRALEAY
jgi:hypothetical protein